MDLVETVRTTGQPRSSLRSSVSMMIPFFWIMSLLFRATTTGMPSSISWEVKKRLRPKFVASTILMMTSGPSFRTKSRVIDSSLVYGDIEYAPGRSTIVIFLFPGFREDLTDPSFFSTVTPGQFPTYSTLPVMALNSVVFPLFGFPAKAIFMMLLLLSL